MAHNASLVACGAGACKKKASDPQAAALCDGFDGFGGSIKGAIVSDISLSDPETAAFKLSNAFSLFMVSSGRCKGRDGFDRPGRWRLLLGLGLGRHGCGWASVRAIALLERAFEQHVLVSLLPGVEVHPPCCCKTYALLGPPGAYQMHSQAPGNRATIYLDCSYERAKGISVSSFQCSCGVQTWQLKCALTERASAIWCSLQHCNCRWATSTTRMPPALPLRAPPVTATALCSYPAQIPTLGATSLMARWGGNPLNRCGSFVVMAAQYGKLCCHP